MQGEDKSSKLVLRLCQVGQSTLQGSWHLLPDGECQTLVGGLTEDLREHAKFFLHSPVWQGLEPNAIAFLPAEGSVADRCAKLSALVHRLRPLLNCRLWTTATISP